MNAETESREVWAEGMLAKILRPAAKKKYLEENESLDNIVKAEAARLVNAVDRFFRRGEGGGGGGGGRGAATATGPGLLISNMAKKAEHVTLLLKDF